jgi:hypothetical protein
LRLQRGVVRTQIVDQQKGRRAFPRILESERGPIARDLLQPPVLPALVITAASGCARALAVSSSPDLDRLPSMSLGLGEPDAILATVHLQRRVGKRGHASADGKYVGTSDGVPQ